MDLRALIAASTLQLAVGLLGLRTALARRHAYEFLWLRGNPEHVARDALTMGTALSAPGPMMVLQGALIVTAATRGDRRAATVLGGLGAVMVAGYLGERLVRCRLTREGWDPLESPLAVAGIGLSAAMAVLGLRRS